jgi:hypothetical protein
MPLSIIKLYTPHPAERSDGVSFLTLFLYNSFDNFAGLFDKILQEANIDERIFYFAKLKEHPHL